MFERLDLIRSRDASPASGSVVDTLQAALLLIRTAPATITAPLVRAIDSQSALHSLRVLSRPTVTDLMIGYLAAQAQTIRLWCGDLPDEGWIEIKVQGAALVEIEQSVIEQACAILGEPLASDIEQASALARHIRHQRLAQLRAHMQVGVRQRPDLAPALNVLTNTLSSLLQQERSRWI